MQAMTTTTVIDLASGPGEAAKAAMTLRLPYLGLCLTEKHVLELQKHLTSWTLDCMAREGHQLYNPKYAQFRATETEKNNPKDSKHTDGADEKAKKKDLPRKKNKAEESDEDVKKSRKDSKESKAKRKASKSPSPTKTVKRKQSATKRKTVISSSGSDSASSGSDE